LSKTPKTNVTIGKYKYYQTTLTIGKDASGKQIQKKFYGKTVYCIIEFPTFAKGIPHFCK
jgi:hypothetical protein